ncbi:FAD-binding domain-containing protein [Massarina eburnea CBS 473.64]|uniref:FAD-binding domain-containing protein n=1 Tax=Massarina eburnea CBS 473.64 TaxID=1395130 RepID=A0A6A6RN62_9PLEO|nr:FAD-binding domain-containing protein [Massarina eburnea CBS 473.64]
MFHTSLSLSTSIAAILSLHVAQAQNSTIFSNPCDALLSTNLSNRILLPSSPLYEPQVQSYWATNARLHPWCFFLPQTTQELATAIATLSSINSNGTEDWHIAVRSGGHSYPGSNNIIKGLTIDFNYMNASSYNASTKLASIQPGGRWKNVYTDLLHTANVTVTGGRDGDVGVAGFLLGGGNSYYSGKNGFACDTVVNYEVVLANGTVVQANAYENGDLYRALKGGGMNFGIVTRFDVLAMPAVDLAYGQHVMVADYSNDVIDAVIDFTEHAESTPMDHLFALYMHSPGSSDVIVAVRVNTEGNLNTKSFEGITSIPAVKESWETMSLADAANASQIASGTMNTGFTLTFLDDASVMRKAKLLMDGLITTLSARIGPDAFMTQIVYQPLPEYYGVLDQTKGGNMLGFDRNGGNAILWVAGVGILGDNTTAFAIAEAELMAVVAELKEFTEKESKLVEFVYLNYADKSQDPLGSYGPENLAFMREVAARYDPKGWWQRMVPGGFKLARVGM